MSIFEDKSYSQVVVALVDDNDDDGDECCCCSFKMAVSLCREAFAANEA